MKRALIIGFILLYTISFWGQTALGQAGSIGPSTDVPPPSPSVSRGDDSGGSLRAPDIENFIRQVESWKQNYPDRFDYLKKLLYKEPFTTQKYVPPAVWVYYSPMNNTTVSRDENIEIGAVVLNQNPIEIRRAIFLDLEVQEPGEKEFKPAKTGTQIIQVNEYNENTNATIRIFPDLKSFSYLKRVGDVKLRIKVSDGQYNYYSSIQKDSPKDGCYGELNMSVYDIPPKINNSTMEVSPNPARWEDFIQYTASLDDGRTGEPLESSIDKSQNAIQVTLHVLLNGTEICNITKPFLSGDPIIFSTKDKSIFNETDAGKNFSYRYSCTDGVIGGENTTWSEVMPGPILRPSSKIRVSNLMIRPENDNYYWWQKYAFGLRMISQNKEGDTVTVTLYTDTPSSPQKPVSSQSVHISGSNYTDVLFDDVEPFSVADRNQPFHYYFMYTSPDQYGKYESSWMDGPKQINSKLISYDLASAQSVGNLLAIVIAALLAGIFIERRFYR